jgi:lysophospholipase L1-like esterase
VLQTELGEGYQVIPEGLCGRTTVWDDPIEEYKNGKAYLIPCLESHKPLDLVVILLGTNDLKVRFSLTAFDVAEGAGRLVKITQKSDTGPDDGPPQVLLLAPPPTVAPPGDWAEMLGDAAERSKGFTSQYRRVAEECGCHFLDTSTVIQSSQVDGIHFDLGEHEKLGKAVAQAVKDILG